MKPEVCKATLFGLPDVCAEANHSIHCMGRWKVGNAYGPWSETVSVTLGA